MIEVSFGISVSELNDSLDEMDVKEVLASRFSPDDFFIMLVLVSTCTLKLKLDNSIEMIQCNQKNMLIRVDIPYKEHI